MSTKNRTWPLAATVAMLALASAGCTGSRGNVTAPSTTAAANTTEPTAPVAPEWWREVGDPTLTALVRQGLDSSQEIACRVSGLRNYDLQGVREARRIGPKLRRLVATDRKALADARMVAREQRVQHLIAQRTRLARQIASSYVEVRRLQAEVALRSGWQNQYKDNAEVAQFRREAGLVSAIDGALARSQSQAAQGARDFAQGRLEEAMAELARLSGNTPEALAATLGPGEKLPDPPVPAPSSPGSGEPRRAALAEEILREAHLAKSLVEARRTVRDARNAYRQGAGDFAALYVALAAVNDVELALVNAKAARVMTTLDLLAEQDLIWAREGLDPPVTTNVSADDRTTAVTDDCD